MKVIDLLNLINNGDELPKKIKFKGKTFYYSEGDLSGNCYYDKKPLCGGNCLRFKTADLNEEIKTSYKETVSSILEDELYDLINPRFTWENKVKKDEKIDYNFRVLKDKINQIIEVINNDTTRN